MGKIFIIIIILNKKTNFIFILFYFIKKYFDKLSLKKPHNIIFVS